MASVQSYKFTKNLKSAGEFARSALSGCLKRAIEAQDSIMIPEEPLTLARVCTPLGEDPMLELGHCIVMAKPDPFFWALVKELQSASSETHTLIRSYGPWQLASFVFTPVQAVDDGCQTAMEYVLDAYLQWDDPETYKLEFCNLTARLVAFEGSLLTSGDLIHQF